MKWTCELCFKEVENPGMPPSWGRYGPRKFLACPDCISRATINQLFIPMLSRGFYAEGKPDPRLDEYYTILKVRAGSRAYGTANPDSDHDYRGVCLPPLRYLVGLDRFEQKEQKEPEDSVEYDLRKFLRLAVDSNPNILEILWIEGENLVVCTEEGHRLRGIREKLLSKRCFKTFGGYAQAQMYRMQHYKPEPGSKKDEDVQKFGYPVKHAMHLMRLLRMGIEVLRDGVVLVARDDAAELMEIRRGEWPLEKVLAEAAKAEVELKAAYEASTLPVRPDYDAANQLCCDLIAERVVLLRGS